eukprot:152752_1
MGNKTISATENGNDVMYPMSINQRLYHLISGYIRLNYLNTKQKHNMISFPIDIINICICFTGIDKDHDYDLIKSRTEIKKEEEFIRNFVDFDASYTDHDIEPRPEIKMLLLGSSGVGKSALFQQLYYNIFLDEYVPTIDDHRMIMKQACVDDRMV